MSLRATFSYPVPSAPGRLTFAVAALAGLAMVAGCSSSSSNSSPTTSASTAAGSTAPAAGTSSSSGNTPAATSSSSPAAAGPAPCATSSLHVKQGLAQGYAGGAYEVIAFNNISFRYPGGLQVFDRFSLRLHAGQRVGLVGQSGGGKSSLFVLLPLN